MRVDSLQTLSLQLEILKQLKESFAVFEGFRTPIAAGTRQDVYDGGGDRNNDHGNADDEGDAENGIELDKPTHGILDPLIFSSDAKRILRGVSMLEKVIVAIEDSELSNVKDAVARVRKYGFYVENFLMGEFIKAVHQDGPIMTMDFEQVKITLEALSILKREVKAVEFFVNNHPIFRELDEFSKGGVTALSSLSLVDSILSTIARIDFDDFSILEIPPVLELFAFIKRRLLETHLEVISTLFSASKVAAIFFQLLERIVFRTIEPLLQTILKVASDSGATVFLYVVDGLYRSCQMGLEAIFHLCTSHLGYNPQFSTQISYRVSLCMEDLFSMYFKPLLLITKEKESMEHLYRILLGEMHFHKKSSGIFSDLFGREGFSSTLQWIPCECSVEFIDQKELSRYWIRDMPLASVKSELDPQQCNNMLLSPNVSTIIGDSLVILKRSITRASRLVMDAKLLGEIFETLVMTWIAFLGDSFLIPVLWGYLRGQHNHRLKGTVSLNLRKITSGENPENIAISGGSTASLPLPSQMKLLFKKLKSITAASFQFQLFFQEHIVNIPIISLENLINEKNKFLSAVEVLINTVLTSLLEVFLCQIKQELSWQVSLGDYSKEANVLQLNSGSSTCVKICKILQDASGLIFDAVGLVNGQLASRQFILQIIRMLALHLMAVKISQKGAILLIRDLDEYATSIEAFRSSGESLALLRSLGQLYVVGAEALVDLIREEPFSKIHREALKSYVASRTDFKRMGLKVLFR